MARKRINFVVAGKALNVHSSVPVFSDPPVFTIDQSLLKTGLMKITALPLHKTYFELNEVG